MEKRNKCSEWSPVETESCISVSSRSDEKESLREPLNHSQSPEVTSTVSIPNTEVNDSFKSLTEKLSAALVNVGAKEDLVKQHAKVAEEAVAGWEKAENEVIILRRQLEAAEQQNAALEVRTNHLDAALKECAKQLRIFKQEQEQRVNEIVEQKTHEWESTKKDLETQISNLHAELQAAKLEPLPATDPKIVLKLESLVKENSTLKSELNVQSEELEIRTIERDLSTQAAETASKQQLESIKKVAKLEAECRRLQSLTRKSPFINDNHKAVSVSSFYVDSLTDSQSVDSFKMNNAEPNEVDQGCSDSWALALMAELDHFKSVKHEAKNVISCSEINNMMDDFLEMERIASLSDGQIETSRCNSVTEDSPMKTELEVMSQRVYELEDALGSTKESLAFSNAQLADTKSQMVDLQRELTEVYKSKELLESRIIGMESEARNMSIEVDSIKADIEKERHFSYKMKLKCEGLEKELLEKTEEVRLQMAVNSNAELKIKKDLEVVAADRLFECQKTISSLARQLESLSTLEDFLIDTTNLPGISGSAAPKTSGELWKLHSNDTFMPKKILMPTKQPKISSLALNGDDDGSPCSSCSSSSSTVSLNHFGARSESKNVFEKMLSKRMSGIQGEIH